MADLQYVISINVEHTRTGQIDQRKAEIIEFAAVLFDLTIGHAKEEFLEVIKPVEKPILSFACKMFSSITQEEVNKGILLSEALQKFEDWLKKAILKYKLVLPKTPEANRTGKFDCAFLTSANELGNGSFTNEFFRKSIRKPLYFNQWINFSELDRNKIIFDLPEVMLKQAFEVEGFVIMGEGRSGINMAKTMAQLFHRLTYVGRNVKITSDMTPSTKEINI